MVDNFKNILKKCKVSQCCGYIFNMKLYVKIKGSGIESVERIIEDEYFCVLYMLFINY